MNQIGRIPVDLNVNQSPFIQGIHDVIHFHLYQIAWIQKIILHKLLMSSLDFIIFHSIKLMPKYCVIDFDGTKFDVKKKSRIKMNLEKNENIWIYNFFIQMNAQIGQRAQCAQCLKWCFQQQCCSQMFIVPLFLKNSSCAHFFHKNLSKIHSFKCFERNQ